MRQNAVESFKCMLYALVDAKRFWWRTHLGVDIHKPPCLLNLCIPMYSQYVLTSSSPTWIIISSLASSTSSSIRAARIKSLLYLPYLQPEICDSQLSQMFDGGWGSVIAIFSLFFLNLQILLLSRSELEFHMLTMMNQTLSTMFLKVVDNQSSP